MDLPDRTTGPVTYDGFISYSHAADDLLGSRLQAGRSGVPSRGGNAGRCASSPGRWTGQTNQALAERRWRCLLQLADVDPIWTRPHPDCDQIDS